MLPPPPDSSTDKQRTLLALLQEDSVLLHLDPRRAGVRVPAWLGQQPQLVLEIGLNLPMPIRDLEIDEAGVRCTLSFQRTPFCCVLPWHSVFAMHSETAGGKIWAESLPRELADKLSSHDNQSSLSAEAPRTTTRTDATKPSKALPQPTEEEASPLPKKQLPSYLRIVK